EFLEHHLELSDPMAELIEELLAESIFASNDSKAFYANLHRIRESLKTHPEELKRFVRLDRKMDQVFRERLQSAKRKRWIYGATGAAIGAVIALPVGKFALGTWSKTLLIAVPAGVLAGG